MSIVDLEKYRETRNLKQSTLNPEISKLTFSQRLRRLLPTEEQRDNYYLQAVNRYIPAAAVVGIAVSVALGSWEVFYATLGVTGAAEVTVFSVCVLDDGLRDSFHRTVINSIEVQK